MKKLVLSVLFGVFAFAICSAQGVSGKWKSSMEGQNGPMELGYTYKVEGTKLTGTVSSPMGNQEIKNGKVTENEIYYEINMMDNVIKFTGKLEKDSIKLTMKMPEGFGNGEAREMKLTRAE